MTRPGKSPGASGSSALETDALTTRPTRRSGRWGCMLECCHVCRGMSTCLSADLSKEGGGGVDGLKRKCMLECKSCLQG